MARNLSNAAASLLPYSTIEAAASGNVDAINAVLKHYERYIAALATRTLYDENGVPHLCLYRGGEFNGIKAALLLWTFWGTIRFLSYSQIVAN